jgi:hypothetical protein
LRARTQLVTLPNNPIEALKTMPNGGFFQVRRSVA